MSDEKSVEKLKASVSAGILRCILSDIKQYSKGAKEEYIPLSHNYPENKNTPITQKQWWLNFEINKQSYQEFALDIRYRVIYMWHIHPDRPEGYSIRWSKLNEIEIECVK